MKLKRLRQQLAHGLLASDKQVTKVRNQWNQEFVAVMSPYKTSSGWAINIESLHKCPEMLYMTGCQNSSGGGYTVMPGTLVGQKPLSLVCLI